MKFKARHALATWDEVIESSCSIRGRALRREFRARAAKIADAVLYEGYCCIRIALRPRKNQVRWQFGVLAPREWSEAGGCEHWWMQTECTRCE